MSNRFVAVRGERAWCRFYALDPMNGGLVTPLETFNCQGWCIDPRRDLPDGAGWGHVLKTLMLALE